MFTQSAGSRRSIARMWAAVIAALCLAATLVAIPTTAEALESSELDGATVYLVNRETGRYVDADSNGRVDQSIVPKDDDKWHLTEVRPGVFTLRNVAHDRLLDADGPDRNNDVNLSSNHESDTEWELNRRGSTYEIRNVEYQLWLDADPSDRGYNVDLTDQVNEPDANWYIALADAGPEDLAGAEVLLSNGRSGRYLDGDADGTVDQSVAPALDDRWWVEMVDGNFTFRNVEQDRLLHGSPSDVDLNGDGGLDTQWGLTQRTDGTYEVRNAEIGLWLDADDSSTDYNVDLTANVDDDDGRWNILVLATDNGCVANDFASIEAMLLCVDAQDAFDHLAALQAIADANGGIRASGTPGYDQSADYVANLLQSAGLTVTRQVFDFSLFSENASAITADGLAIETQTMEYSGSGAVVGGLVTAIDIQLGLDNTSTSGCEVDDFIDIDLSGPNDIALIQRGACNFSDKALNAADAGAEAVIIFNQGNAEGRFDIIGATLGDGVVGVLDIPVLDVSYDDGVALLTAEVVDVSADTTIETNSTENVIADMPGINTGNVVMAGAHLDSVQAGPGIQDNGSGSTALLAVALALANNDEYVPQNSLRFAWWGAEEAGLIGSTNYIFHPDFGISDEDYFALAAYLNFDMIASPNFLHGVYDANESTFVASAPVPDGSIAIEHVFEAFYSLKAVPYDDSAFSGRSDYQAFIDVGIPSSGLFTGAEGIKTPEQAAIWGGTAGDQYDPCYHLACDTVDNVSYTALEINVDAVAYAIFNLAASTASVNGVPGAIVDGPTPDQVVIDGPQGTFAEPGGAGASEHSSTS